MDLSELNIRKIIAGVDPLKAMAFVVGQSVAGNAEITNIELDERELIKNNVRQYVIWIQKENGESFIWKTITNMPVIVEYDCNF